jgi:hypothetical protein
MKKPSIVELDGFADHTDETEGDGETLDTSSRAIIGDRLKFVDPRWTLGGADVTGMLATLVGTRNVVTKWGPDRKPLITQILAPGEKWPNFKAFNDECPRSEWRDEFGTMKGPWSGQHCLYFIDENGRRLTWPSPITTIGSCIAVNDIIKDVQVARKFRGQDVFAVVKLDHTNYSTKVGMKQRPKLVIVRLVAFGSSGASTLPEPDARPAIDAARGAPADAQPVAPLTASEEIGDVVPY